MNPDRTTRGLAATPLEKRQLHRFLQKTQPGGRHFNYCFEQPHSTSYDKNGISHREHPKFYAKEPKVKLIMDV